ncbi:MAG TPA: thioredoxin-like domain-containing protein [Bacteroidales bacterium]|nr:thioredoxin-like domain-containing protein [Bacteroidales bacterium]
MKKILLLLLFLGSLGMSTQLKAANDGYLIRFQVQGMKDTICLIATYYGNGTYVKDTVKVDAAGRFTFKANADFPKGIYLAVINDKSYFEFIVNNDRKFSMETDRKDLSGKMVITGSPENQLFYDYLKYNKTRFAEIQALQKLIVRGKTSKDSIKLLNDKSEAINKEIIRYKLEIAEKHPSSFVAFFINAMREPEVPEIPTLSNGRKDSTFAYRYIKAHYWDGTDFTDDRLLRTPVFDNKLKKYFDKILYQNPDSIIKETDILIEKARPNPEMFKYLVWYATYHSENSEIMGFDRIFVHVVDSYYLTHQVTWERPAVVENLIKKANKISPLLIGQIPPNMVMLDTNNQPVSMYSVKSNFLILFFWDPDCGNCEQEIPKLKEFYDKNKDTFGLKIFTICSDSSLVKWKLAIRKKKMDWINVNGPRTLTGDYHEQYDISTTPVVYILNNRKEIIAKRLVTDQLLQFFKNYIKQGLN